MNKKIIIIAIIIIILIITAVIILNHKENNTKTVSQQGNQITKEEYNENIIESVEEKLLSAGIEIRQSGISRYGTLEGNKYEVPENGELTEKNFEMYIINPKEKTQLLGKDAEDGKVTIDENTQGILSENILFINISDEELSNQIIKAMNI